MPEWKVSLPMASRHGLHENRIFMIYNFLVNKNLKLILIAI